LWRWGQFLAEICLLPSRRLQVLGAIRLRLLHQAQSAAQHRDVIGPVDEPTPADSPVTVTFATPVFAATRSPQYPRKNSAKLRSADGSRALELFRENCLI